MSRIKVVYKESTSLGEKAVRENKKVVRSGEMNGRLGASHYDSADAAATSGRAGPAD